MPNECKRKYSKDVCEDKEQIHIDAGDEHRRKSPSIHESVSNASGAQKDMGRPIAKRIAFFEWRADHMAAPFAEWMKQYMMYFHASEPYALSYARMVTELPQRMREFEAIVMPIQRMILGTE
jgi:hypothetical protein